MYHRYSLERLFLVPSSGLRLYRKVGIITMYLVHRA